MGEGHHNMWSYVKDWSIRIRKVENHCPRLFSASEMKNKPASKVLHSFQTSVEKWENTEGSENKNTKM